MLHVMAVLRFKPGSSVDPSVNNALTRLALESRNEPGCIRYEVFRRANEDIFVTQEIWVDKTSLDAHMAGPNVGAAVASVGHLLAASPEIHHYSRLI